MAGTGPDDGAKVLDPGGIDSLISILREQGYETIGPTVDAGAVVYEPISGTSGMPVGCIDEQDGGHYRLTRTDSPALFDYVVGPQSWKRYLYPAEQTLWTASRRGKGFTIENDLEKPRYALIGVRACELAALGIHDRVFDNGDFADSGYLLRRGGAFVVAVNCGRAGGTCFCASMGTGPQAEGGYDLTVTELVGDGRHEFVVESGSEKGAEVLAMLPGRAAKATDLDAARARVAKAAASMGREMVDDPAGLLARNRTHPRWDEVAKRCLGCANCTMVCPTCFCSTVEDVTDLTGNTAQRVRRWDSCFTMDFSYIHGGSIRRETAARYRHWITHKLSTWFEQFGRSGCTGCGRCITWCPVGIDITEEARAIRDSDGKGRA